MKAAGQVRDITELRARVLQLIEQLKPTFGERDLAELRIDRDSLREQLHGVDEERIARREQEGVEKLTRQLELLCIVVKQWQERYGQVQVSLRGLASEFVRRHRRFSQIEDPVSLLGGTHGQTFVESLRTFYNEWNLGRPPDFQDAYGIWLEAKGFCPIPTAADKGTTAPSCASNGSDAQSPLPLFYVYNVLKFGDRNSVAWKILSRVMQLRNNSSTARQAEALLRQMNLPMDPWGTPMREKCDLNLPPNFEADLASLEAVAGEGQERSPHGTAGSERRRDARARRSRRGSGVDRMPGVSRFARTARAALRRGVGVR